MSESSLERLPDPSTENLPNPSIPEQKPSLMRRVIRGVAWTFGGHAANQVIRLANNLILSRLLFPEAFGLMALVYTVLTGLHMLSDTGTNANIIQSKRGDDQAFLNTAWTVDCIRGGILWLCACLLAAPMASFYKEPLLAYLLPVSGLTLLLGGFQSNKIALANRNLALGRLTIIDLSVQISGIVVILMGAVLAKSVGAPKDVAIWALVVGNLVSSIVQLILSYTFLEGENNRFQLEPKALHEIIHFGKWIFLSTLLTFFALQGNNLIIPRLLGFTFLGVFSFASSLSQLASGIVTMMESRVLFPSYSELHRDRPERLRPILRRSRLVLNGVNCAVAVFFICFGQLLIRIMYDARYSDAGWILQFLALGSIMSVLVSTYSNVLLAQGKTSYMSLMMLVQMVVQFGAMFLGFYLGKEFGLVLGLAFSGWAIYPFAAIIYARLALWQPEVDLPIIGLASGVAVLMFIF
jgi:O-antigen/teichoic acid export membrane protein